MKITSNSIFLLALMAVCLTGCAPGDSSGPKTYLTVWNMNPGYQFTVHVNGEPVHSAQGQSLVSLVGFPLLEGTNDVKVSFLSVTSKDLRCRVVLVEGGRQSFDEDVKMTMEGESLEKDFQIVLTADLPAETEQLDSLKGVATERFDGVRKACLNIVSLLQSNKFEELSKQFNYPSEPGPPQWVLDLPLPITDKLVTELSDVDLLVGDKYIVARPSSQFTERTQHSALFYVKKPKEDVSLEVGSSRFVMINGKFHVVLGTGTMAPIE